MLRFSLWGKLKILKRLLILIYQMQIFIIEKMLNLRIHVVKRKLPVFTLIGASPLENPKWQRLKSS